MVFCNYIDGRGYKHPKKGHNPYFNRWFSAIVLGDIMVYMEKESQSLF